MFADLLMSAPRRLSCECIARDRCSESSGSIMPITVCEAFMLQSLTDPYHDLLVRSREYAHMVLI